ncbi:hypothetical protein F4813DRAFT_381115 [Daldinia decipiens]|uniref:uncharacterized protein n=1 Tax=Daldinia decipiens TaxID=326647 RepID=UPI0020C318BE|nr:uncharacterized protein F4813DRAFT_381115 [Daldinia decipiens]KAI1657042.1 hypothetical protein F4813DRAFT_381115 [Daldinia decipiens]
MEALAALGLVSNVLQLIECGYKVVLMAKELHESRQDSIQTNNNTAFVAHKMRELSTRVMKCLPSSDLTEDEKALCRLAQQCSELSNRLLVLLENLKAKKPGSKLDIITTLQIQISTMSRDHIQKLQHRVVVDSDNTIANFQKIQEVVEIQFKQTAILQSLRYPRMHDRFENVKSAHRNTFEWLLEGPETPSSQEHQEYAVDDNHGSTGFNLNNTSNQAKYQKYREFSAWLRGGVDHLHVDIPSHSSTPNGPYKENIFHITGKPGAGKSTLMKFLCQSEITLKHLKAWAGEKHLIFAKAFFWRLGDDEQKNLPGLTTCLLRQILKAAPVLIPVVFPSQRESDYENSVPFDPSGTQAFKLLLQSGRTFENYKMVFFIDGLDYWITINYACLKIYRFEELSEISSLVNKHDLNSLAGTIVDKAEGVFLWVPVVLAAIKQGVLNGDELRDLRGKVAAFPTELNDLYQHLFDSIPEYDRQKAFKLLNLTYNIGITKPMPILQHKFLNDLSTDPDFAIKLPRQINGLCKGFLEVGPMQENIYKNIEEFLRNHVRLIRSYLSGIDMMDRICQSFLAFIKSISINDFHGTEDSPGSKNRFLGFLENVEQIAIPEFQKGIGSKRKIRSFNAIVIADYSSYRTSPSCKMFMLELPSAQLITILAAGQLLFEYFDKDGRCDLRTQTDPEFRQLIAHAVLSGVSMRLDGPRVFQMFEILFEAGETKDHGDLWAWLLRRLVLMGPHETHLYQSVNKSVMRLRYRLIELFIRHGASEDFTLTFGPCYEGTDFNRLLVRVHAGDSNCRRTTLDLEIFKDICIDYQLDIVSFARERGGVLTLRDLFAYWLPQDCSHLYALLDKKCSTLFEAEDISESRDSPPPRMPAVFPEKHRCFEPGEHGEMTDQFDPRKVPDGYRQCLSHSEKCFMDFKAKLESKGLGHLCKCFPISVDEVQGEV